MIDWKSIKELHVNKKLEQIIGGWYGLDIFYADEQGRVQFLTQNDYPFKSPFFKLQMSQSFGHEWLEADVEKVFETFNHKSDQWMEWEAFFPKTFGYAHKVEVDGEVHGAIFAYPYIKETCTSEDMDKIVQKMVECGVSEADAKESVTKMKKFSD